MTSPTRVTMPRIQYEATPANPHTGGLYSAATLTTLADPDRLDGGVEVTPVNEGGHGFWDTGCGPQDDEAAVKAGDRPARDSGDSTIVWAADDCSLIGNSAEEAEARAAQLLRLYEPVDVEVHTAPRLLLAAGTAATAPVGDDAFAKAVGALEATLGLTGTSGVIHASRAMAAVAAKHGLLVASASGRLTTPLGNAWAFGAGYGALGTTLVATGPVTVRRSSVTANNVVNTRQNERTAIAERIVNVVWELGASAQETA